MPNLDEIVEKLKTKKQELQHRMEKLDNDLQRRSKPLEKDFAEQAVERENDEVLEALLHSSRQEVKQINQALKRIEEGEYLSCSVCGEEIPFARLEAVPYTDVCVACAERRHRK